MSEIALLVAPANRIEVLALNFSWSLPISFPKLDFGNGNFWTERDYEYC